MRESMAGSLIGRRAQALAEGPMDAGMTRREALAVSLMNLGSASLVSGVVIERAWHAGTGRAKAAEVISFPSRAALPEAQPLGHQVPPELVGRMPAGLECRYLGPEASGVRLPETLPPIAFGKNLRAMLDEKRDIVADARTGSMQQRVYARLADSYDALAESGRLRMTDLAGFRELIEQETYATLESLDDRFDDIARIYFREALAESGLQDAEARTLEVSLASALRYLARHVTPDIQLAYIMTEIMPSPERGPALLSFLLENAGMEFIERIPALGDTELSYGPFQLTPYAVGEEGSASRFLANARRSDLAPGDLAHFSSIEDHLRAGFAFGMYNLTALIQDLVKRRQFAEVAVLCESASSGSANGRATVFLEYLASAHHRPVVAREVMHAWLEENASRPKAARATSLAPYFDDSPASEQVKVYAGKAEQHFKHLQRFFAARARRT